MNKPIGQRALEHFASRLEIHALLAALSRAVYFDWPKAEQAVAVMGVPMIEHASHRDAECMLVMAEDGSFAAIVFRGTEFTDRHYRDIWNNAGRPQAWAGAGLVHSGYLAQLERIRDRAAAWFEKVPSSCPLYVAGHSMGGAVGGLFAAWAIGVRGGKLAGLATFGAPKAGSARAWAPLRQAARRDTARGLPDGFDLGIYRIRYGFAPYWPPSLKLTQPAEAVVLPSPNRWLGPIRRHDVDNYVEAVRAHAEAA